MRSQLTGKGRTSHRSTSETLLPGHLPPGDPGERHTAGLVVHVPEDGERLTRPRLSIRQDRGVRALARRGAGKPDLKSNKKNLKQLWPRMGRGSINTIRDKSNVKKTYRIISQINKSKTLFYKPKTWGSTVAKADTELSQE